MEKTYTIIFYVDGKEFTRREGVDKLNATIIPAECKMKWEKEFESGHFAIKVAEE